MTYLIRILAFCLVPISLAVSQDEGVEMAVRAVNDFAIAHHRRMPTGNVLVSPWSVQTSLAMLASGASGETRAEMEQVLFPGMEEEVRNRSFGKLQRKLTSELETTVGMEFRAANWLFVSDQVQLAVGWRKVILDDFESDVVQSDFVKDAEGERTRINRWVNDQTGGKVPEVIPPNGLDKATQVVLVNAVYFQMPWEEQFTKSLTKEQPFFLDLQSFKRTPLMFKQHAQRYSRQKGFQIAALPYGGDAYQFVVFVPDAIDGLPELERQLTGTLLTECARLPRTEIRLYIPRIHLEPPITSLTKTLSAMGVDKMFRETANFSRMIDGGPKAFCVSDIFHRTYLELDEKGTKAAAATAIKTSVKMNGEPAPRPHQNVVADRPFLFMIQHIPTGACLFLGRFSDPAPEMLPTTEPDGIKYVPPPVPIPGPSWGVYD